MSALNSWSQMYAANIFRGYSYTAPCILSHGLHVTCSEYISEVQSSLIKNDLKSKYSCFIICYTLNAGTWFVLQPNTEHTGAWTEMHVSTLYIISPCMHTGSLSMRVSLKKVLQAWVESVCALCYCMDRECFVIQYIIIHAVIHSWDVPRTTWQPQLHWAHPLEKKKKNSE